MAAVPLEIEIESDSGPDELQVPEQSPDPQIHHSRRSRAAAGSPSSKSLKTSLSTHVVLHSLEDDVSTKFSMGNILLDDPVHPWSKCRILVAKVLHSRYAEFAIGLVISFNVGLIMHEVDQEAQCYPKFASDIGSCPTSTRNNSWLETANLILLGIYCTEAALRFYVLRSKFFESKIDVLDLLLCVGSLLIVFIGSADAAKISWLRIFRYCRILHAARFVSHIDELEVLLAGFIGMLKAMFFGMLMIFALLCFFSILAVHFVHPINSQIKYDSCDRCPRGFQSILDSMLTLYQQIVAGDDWGTISIPIVEKNRLGLMLPLFQIVIGIGAMNLILAVIVERAFEARGKDREAAAKKKAANHKFRKLQLLDLVRTIDSDNTGVLHRAAILDSIQNNRELQTRIALSGLRQGEVKKIIDALASPDTQAIGYKSFSNVLDDLDAADVRKTVVLTKVMVSGMQRRMEERLDKQSEEITAIRRGIEQLIDLHHVPSPSGTADETNAQPHPENVKQERSAAWSLRQHNCAHNISTDDLDPHLGKPIIDAILSCRAEIDNEKCRGQQSLIQLDTKWSASLRALRETLLACTDADESRAFNARFLAHATRTHQALERRRHNWFEDITRAIEDDFSFWERQCSLLGASDNWINCGFETHRKAANDPTIFQTNSVEL